MNHDLAVSHTPPAQRIAEVVKPAAPVNVSATHAAAPTPTASPANVAQDARDIERNVQEAVDRLNEQMRHNNRGLNFSIDRAANRTVITVKNTETGEVIRQIPDEKLLRVSHNIEALKGMLHNETS